MELSLDNKYHAHQIPSLETGRHVETCLIACIADCMDEILLESVCLYSKWGSI